MRSDCRNSAFLRFRRQRSRPAGDSRCAGHRSGRGGRAALWGTLRGLLPVQPDLRLSGCAVVSGNDEIHVSATTTREVVYSRPTRVVYVRPKQTIVRRAAYRTASGHPRRMGMQQ